MLIRKRVIREDLPLVFVNLRIKLRAGGYRFAGIFERTCLVIDCDIVAHIHATGSTLPADENHQNSPSTEILKDPVLIMRIIRSWIDIPGLTLYFSELFPRKSGISLTLC